MTITGKFNKVMQSGLEFQIYNKPVQDDMLWDINIFWRQMQGKKIEVDCRARGFCCIDDCIDDMLIYIGEGKYIGEDESK